MKLTALSPKICECGKQGYIKDTRQWAKHVYRKYFCECGQSWSTKEFRQVEISGENRKLKDALADKLISLAQELMR